MVVLVGGEVRVVLILTRVAFGAEIAVEGGAGGAGGFGEGRRVGEGAGGHGGTSEGLWA